MIHLSNRGGNRNPERALACLRLLSEFVTKQGTPRTLRVLAHSRVKRTDVHEIGISSFEGQVKDYLWRAGELQAQLSWDQLPIVLK